MKKITFYTSPFIQNKVFDLDDPIANINNFAYPHWKLKDSFFKNGYDLSTQDINSTLSSEAIIYNDMPKSLPKADDINRSYLMLFECEIIKPRNWNLNSHKHFKKIFTWDDRYVDNKKYFKINFSHFIPETINKNILGKTKLCSLIAGNKKFSHKLELYSERVKAIRWFEKNHPKDFDLYGVRWDEYRFGHGLLGKPLNKLKFLRKSGNYPSYKGKVNCKNKVLQNYKFAICYENARDIPSYITEKIFDCFFAGCVPIYWGANNITDYVPENCFIDKRKFDTYEELYDFMVNMSDSDYVGYLDNIEKYIQSDQIKIFSADHFADVITTEILNDITVK
ncbi:glycosyltransferase family 10 [Francisellaceae bacterium CB299]